MKIQLDVPEDVHHQLTILQAVGKFKNLPDTANYVLAINIGELVSKEAKTLRREIKKERKDTDAVIYSKDDVDSAKTKNKLKDLRNSGKVGR